MADDAGLVEALRWYLPRTVTTLILKDVRVSVPGLVALTKELKDLTFLEARSTTLFTPVPSKIRTLDAEVKELVRWEWQHGNHWPHQESRVHFVFSLLSHEDMQLKRKVFDV